MVKEPSFVRNRGTSLLAWIRVIFSKRGVALSGENAKTK